MENEVFSLIKVKPDGTRLTMNEGIKDRTKAEELKSVMESQFPGIKLEIEPKKVLMESQ